MRFRVPIRCRSLSQAAFPPSLWYLSSLGLRASALEFTIGANVSITSPTLFREGLKYSNSKTGLGGSTSMQYYRYSVHAMDV